MHTHWRVDFGARTNSILQIRDGLTIAVVGQAVINQRGEFRYRWPESTAYTLVPWMSTSPGVRGLKTGGCGLVSTSKMDNKRNDNSCCFIARIRVHYLSYRPELEVCSSRSVM